MYEILRCGLRRRRELNVHQGLNTVPTKAGEVGLGAAEDAAPTLRRERSEAVSNRISRHEDCRFSLHPQPLENTREFFYFAITLLGKASEMIRIHPRLGTICYLLIASYSLPRNLCHIRALEDMFP